MSGLIVWIRSVAREAKFRLPKRQVRRFDMRGFLVGWLWKEGRNPLSQLAAKRQLRLRSSSRCEWIRLLGIMVRPM